MFFTNFGPGGLVISSGRVGRCVVTNFDPTLVQIVPVAPSSLAVVREVGEDAVTRGTVRGDSEGPAAGGIVDP